MIIRNMIYAILLGVSMAACLSQQDEQATTATEVTAPEESALPLLDEEAPATQPARANFAIAKGHVGDVKIGMPIAALRTHVPVGLHIKDTTLTQEGQQSTAYVLTPTGQQKGILVEQQCAQECQVWRISILSPMYKTAKGMGVGSKYGELQKAYDIKTVTFEEGNLVALAPEAGMSFLLDESQLTAEQLAQINAANLPANTLVKKVLVY